MGAKVKLRGASPEAPVCRWFARCDERAATTQAHPILGEVPICQRCADWYKRMEGKN